MSKQGNVFIKIDSLETKTVSMYRYVSNKNFEKVKTWVGAIDMEEYEKLRNEIENPPSLGDGFNFDAAWNS